MRTTALLLMITAFSKGALADDDIFDLGVIEVNAKVEQPSDKETLTYEDIARNNRNDVASALDLLPGVSVQNLGARNERLIYLRGFNSRQVPLFMDGIPVYVPYDGNVDLNRFTTFDIGQIDVSKGNASVLYGPNTLGGSVNLVSRRPSRKLEANLTAGMGMDSQFDANYYQTALNFGSNQGLWYIQGGASYLDRQFWRLSDDFKPTASEDGGIRENSGNTDYKGNIKLGLTPNATDEYALTYINQNGRKDTPPYAGTDKTVSPRFWRWPYWDKESVYFLSRTQFGDAHTVKLRAYHDTFENSLQSYDDASYNSMRRPYAFDSRYDDYTFGGGIEYGNTWFDQHDLKLAFSYKQDVHREVGNKGQPQQRFADELFSYAIEDSYTPLDNLRFVVGASYDQQKQIQAQNLIDNQLVSFPLSGTKDAYNVQGSTFYQIADDLQLHASLARKTRFPTIKDRFSYRLGTALPNPALQPEDALNYELGLDGKALGWLDYGGNLFFSQIDDTIESVTLPNDSCSRPPCSQLQNIGQQENLGVELFATAQINDQWRAHANYTWLDRNNISNPGIYPTDTPRHKIFTYLEYQPVQYLRLLASAEYNGKRYSNTTGTRIAEDFVVGNLKATFIATEQLSAEFGVNNVADQNYAYEEGFPEPGRNYFANLNLSY
ncbi:TonB-dependent siderophore receptor [Methylobacter sp. BlB1]|uniref:TonB-dependent receptor plug domain-containing protein n=1 Tax=Methylobacter sp. BlB1 TaxID=2785914 RepID=UPI00189618B1|nr:TonB-dependent receptor [Methylobacter sp. BlB1]MBF6651017.1 TonB-dependent receptor [Methylobacter sp. BlB1]